MYKSIYIRTSANGTVYNHNIIIIRCYFKQVEDKSEMVANCYFFFWHLHPIFTWLASANTYYIMIGVMFSTENTTSKWISITFNNNIHLLSLSFLLVWLGIKFIVCFYMLINISMCTYLHMPLFYCTRQLYTTNTHWSKMV